MTAGLNSVNDHASPSKANRKNFVKIPPDLQENLDQDQYRIQKLKEGLIGIGQQRMETPDILKQQARARQLQTQASDPMRGFNPATGMTAGSPPKKRVQFADEAFDSQPNQ